MVYLQISGQKRADQDAQACGECLHRVLHERRSNNIFRTSGNNPSPSLGFNN